MYKLNEQSIKTMQSMSTSLIFAKKCLSEFYASDTFKKLVQGNKRLVKLKNTLEHPTG